MLALLQNKRTKCAEIVWGSEWMKCIFSIVFVFQLIICIVALSSL